MVQLLLMFALVTVVISQAFQSKADVGLGLTEQNAYYSARGAVTALFEGFKDATYTNASQDDVTFQPVGNDCQMVFTPSTTSGSFNTSIPGLQTVSTRPVIYTAAFQGIRKDGAADTDRFFNMRTAVGTDNDFGNQPFGYGIAYVKLSDSRKLALAELSGIAQAVANARESLAGTPAFVGFAVRSTAPVLNSGSYTETNFDKATLVEGNSYTYREFSCNQSTGAQTSSNTTLNYASKGSGNAALHVPFTGSNPANQFVVISFRSDNVRPASAATMNSCGASSPITNAINAIPLGSAATKCALLNTTTSIPLVGGIVAGLLGGFNFGNLASNVGSFAPQPNYYQNQAPAVGP